MVRGNHMSNIFKKVVKQSFDMEGRLHNDDGPCNVYDDESFSYYDHGKLHRLNGPAEYDAVKNVSRYSVNGLRHRIDGPAVLWDGSKQGLWYVNGFCVDKEIRQWSNEMEIDLENLSEDDKVIIAMMWSDYGNDKE